jgi:hypothetical protein
LWALYDPGIALSAESGPKLRTHEKKNVFSVLKFAEDVISLNLYVEGKSPFHDLVPCSVLGQALKLPHIGCRKQSR